MQPTILGQKYDKIAHWWHDRHDQSDYGVAQVEKALSFAANSGKALDAGCGAGGRFVRQMQDKGYAITGLDVSEKMVALARQNHPKETFLHQDITTWETTDSFDFILAWDSLFHLPLETQKPVLEKLCTLLAPNGIFIYTFGDAEGEHTDQWHGDSFAYSSIGINENLKLLIEHGLSIRHIELDQFPENHAYIIAKKMDHSSKDEP